MAVESCVIVGAGLAGLVAARKLQENGVQVAVLDKGRGVGGRMATRRIENGIFDHGAQYFTVRDARFRQLVDEWLDAGVAVEWARGFGTVENPEASGDGNPRYRGSTGMTAIPRYLARDLDVRLSQTVQTINLREDGWHLETKEGLSISGKSLLLTAPIPQSITLINSGNYQLADDVRQSLEPVGDSYAPCFAVMALLDAPSHIPAPGGLFMSGDPLSWIADNHQKGISPDAHAITLHAGADFSRRHFDDDQDSVARMMLYAAKDWLGADVRSYQIHLWRYSIPSQVYPQPCLYVAEQFPLVFAGEIYFGPRVEGAAVSGLSAAEQLLG